jgi:hypothetical protein
MRRGLAKGKAWRITLRRGGDHLHVIKAIRHPVGMAVFTLPTGYHRIKVVTSFHELVTTPFADGINALCWQRSLPGDFSEVVSALGVREDMATLDEAYLRTLQLSDAGKTAVEILLADQELLRAHGLAPILDCIHGYPRDEDTEVVPTHVYSFHADSAPVEADTYLCTYSGASSEGLRNDEAHRRVDVMETRAALLEQYGGADDAAFSEYLRENCYDLHYAPAPHAQPFSFGVGNLWRIAIQHPESLVPPCIHRAPETLAGEPPRLLLIS